VNYFSEVIQLRSTTSHSIINSLKVDMVYLRILEQTMVLSFSSQKFTEFVTDYRPSWKDYTDFIPLLSYRTTPLPWCGKSLAELLMGRRLHSCQPSSNYRESNEGIQWGQQEIQGMAEERLWLLPPARSLSEIPDNMYQCIDYHRWLKHPWSDSEDCRHTQIIYCANT